MKVSVPASIGAVELRQECLSAISEKWHTWSNGYPLPMERVAIEHKGVPIFSDKDCILQYFAKKSRGGAAIRTYDFSTVLELHLLIENQFYQEVCEHQEQEFKAPDTSAQKVSVSSTTII